MSIPIRSASDIAAKFAEVTPGRSAQYADGVSNPQRDWEAETVAAEASFETGIRNAITNKSFGKGVKRAGTQKWQQAAQTKGVDRFGPGVAAAEDAYREGFAPFRDVIAGLTLPPRREKGNPANLNRVKVVSEALHAKKLSLQ